MELFIQILVCFFAGLGAGVGTGFAGLSAAAVVSPMLIVFLDLPAYEAVGIGLASDVLASAVSAYTYHKHKNLDIRNGLVMMCFVLAFTVLGSFLATLVPSPTMGIFSIAATMLLGLRFILKPVMTTREQMDAIGKKSRIIRAMIGGSLIGLICGFIGAGGGMMMLLVLTSFLGYELKCAVGTSVFVMTFSALTGSVSHFAFDGMPDLLLLGLCAAFTLLWARVAAKIANRAKPQTLNRCTGIVLLVTGTVMLSVDLFFK